MTKTVLVCFHNYVPMYDHKYFDVILDYFMRNFEKYWQDEVDKLYLLDSNWEVKDISNPKVEVIKTDPNMRYCNTYKAVLPTIKEDAVLLLDNDMVIYRKGIVKDAFKLIENGFDVVSIYDTIGEKTFEELGGKSKFCPYLFAVKKDLLMKFRDCDWEDDMPHYETLGQLTEEMLKAGLKPFEMEEDKNSIYFDGVKDKPKNLGYYHIRAGSTPAYLLTHRNLGNRKTYEEFIKGQPKREILRQVAWYWLMADEAIRKDVIEVVMDCGMRPGEFRLYVSDFKEFHGLEEK